MTRYKILLFSVFLGLLVFHNLIKSFSSLKFDIKNLDIHSQAKPVKISSSDINFLKKTLLEKGIYFGSTIGPADIQIRPPRPLNFLKEVSKYFNFYTISTTFRTTELAQRGKFTFDSADKSVEFALNNKAKIKAHTLVMGESLPEWLKNGNFKPEELKAILKNHIQTIVKHFKEKYPGKIAIWHVVNEPSCNGGPNLDSDLCLEKGVEKNIWTAIHKPGSNDPTDYIQLAFEWAKEADPEAKLYLNESGIEIENHPKVERTYQLVKYLKRKGTPIDGVGIQGHVRLYEFNKYSSKGLINIMDRFFALNLEVQITEFDVLLAKGNRRISKNKPTIQIPLDKPAESDYIKQAELYKIFLNACLNAKNCTGFTTWGPWDGGSWTNNHWEGKFYPHLLDNNLQPKFAFKALVEEAKQYNSKNK